MFFLFFEVSFKVLRNQNNKFQQVYGNKNKLIQDIKEKNILISQLTQKNLVLEKQQIDNQSLIDDLSNQLASKNLLIQSQKDEILDYKNLIAQLEQQNEQFNLLKQISKCQIKVGLKNLGNTCYINAAIQALRHLYFSEPLLLEICKTEFQLQLKVFFQTIGNSNDSSTSTQLQNLINVSKKDQKHQFGGGDSYFTFCNYLKQIYNQILQKKNQQDISRYQNIYNIFVEDGLQCAQCKNFNNQNEKHFNLEEQLESYILNSVSQLQNISENIKCEYAETTYELCPTCNRETQFQTKRVIKKFPEFFIIKFLNTYQQRIKFPQVIKFSQKEVYTIIGYCTYTGNHYYYTGKYQQEWIVFNDDSVYPEKQPNLSQVSYVILQKIKQS